MKNRKQTTFVGAMQFTYSDAIAIFLAGDACQADDIAQNILDGIFDESETTKRALTWLAQNAA